MLLVTTVLSKSGWGLGAGGVGAPCFPIYTAPACPGRLHSSLLRSSLLSLLLSGRGWELAALLWDKGPKFKKGLL